MIITTDLLEHLEQMSKSEIELLALTEKNSKIAIEFCMKIKEKYKFMAKEEKILIASEIIKDDENSYNQLRVYYTYNDCLIIKSRDELYIQLELSDVLNVYYCLMSKDLLGRNLLGGEEFEFDKRVNKLYYDKKLSKVGILIADIYSVLLK